MKEIGPLVIDSLMSFIQLIFESLAVIGAILSLGKPSLDILDLDCSILRKSRILYRISIAIYDKRFQA
jgi:hypothetical protein